MLLVLAVKVLVLGGCMLPIAFGVLGTGILFAGGGEIEISQYTRVGIGCIISAQSEDSFANPEVRPDNHQHIFEKVVIGKNCLIAGGAIILGGTTFSNMC